MWTCPICKRSFKLTNQSHYCNNTIDTVNAYIQAQEKEKQEILELARKTIKEAIPDAIECLAWDMPTYRKQENLIHFAAHKSFYSLYPGEEAVLAFQDQLKDYKYNKGTIQIPYTKPVPVRFIKDLAKWCEKNARGEKNE